MAKTKPLTKAERAWLIELQELLNRCPSKRIGFITIGDPSVTIYDVQREDEIDQEQQATGCEWGTAAARIEADFGGVCLFFPNAVQSTSG